MNIVLFFSLQATVFLALTLVPGLDGEFKMIHAEYHWGHGDGKFMKMYEVEAQVDLFGNKLKAGTEVATRASANAGVDVDCAFPPV